MYVRAKCSDESRVYVHVSEDERMDAILNLDGAWPDSVNERVLSAIDDRERLIRIEKKLDQLLSLNSGEQ